MKGEVRVDPEEFDYIIVGTGAVQSLVAAAISMAGHTVLHVDVNDYYGGSWASMSLHQYVRWATENQTTENKDQVEDAFFSPENHIYSQMSARFASEKDQENLLGKSRMFNLERRVRMVLSSGEFVKLLIDSQSSDYFLFCPVDEQYLLLEDKVEKVPVSKSDIFQSKMIPLAEKRALMKFVHQVIGLEERFAKQPTNLKAEVKENEEDFDKLPFVEFLKEHGISPQMQNILLYCVCHISETQVSSGPNCVTTKAGLERLRSVVASMKRFGSGCYIFPQYGTGTVPEMMTRKCSVFGGVYVLPLVPKRLVIDENEPDSPRCSGILTPFNQFLRAKNAVLCSLETLSTAVISSLSPKYFSHTMLILDRPISPLSQNDPLETRNKCFVMTIPPGTVGIDNIHPVRVIQLDGNAKVCPIGYYVVYITTRSVDENIPPESETEATIKRLCGLISTSDGPNVPLFESHYKERIFEDLQLETDAFTLPSNVYLSSEQTPDISISDTIESAKALFTKLLPDKKFFDTSLIDHNLPSEVNDDAEVFDLLKDLDI